MRHCLSKISIAFFVYSIFPVSLPAYQDISITEEVKDNIRERVNSGENIGIVVGITDSGKTQFFCYGKRSVRGNEQVNENSIFELASVTKVFTTLLLADMVLKNKLALDDPIEKYLPEKVKVPSRNGKKITFEHLATHTSVLPRFPDNNSPADQFNPFAEYSVEKLYEFLSGHILKRDIGEQYEYSNLGMGLLGHILSLKEGKNFEELVLERICSVLGMKTTGVSFSPDIQKRQAKGHHNGREVPDLVIASSLVGGGGLRSSAVDMLKFINAFIGVTETRLTAAMEMCSKPHFNTESTLKIGLGWHLSYKSGKEIIYHTGGSQGFSSTVGFVKDKKIGAVVLSNSPSSIDDICFHLLANTYEMKKNEKEIIVPDEILEKYYGEYEIAPGNNVGVAKTEGGILISYRGRKARFVALSKNVFFLKSFNVTIEFIEDEDGKVTGLKMSQTGDEQIGKKIK